MPLASSSGSRPCAGSPPKYVAYRREGSNLYTCQREHTIHTKILRTICRKDELCWIGALESECFGMPGRSQYKEAKEVLHRLQT